jgi:hypothetical protein
VNLPQPTSELAFLIGMIPLLRRHNSTVRK